MTYKKLAYSKLHHIETHGHDDGSYSVQAHLVHRPPQHNQPGAKDSEKLNQHAYAVPGEDYPNKTVTHTAEDREEATQIHGQILEAHQYDTGRKRGVKTHGDHNVTAEEEYEEA